jgi:hypothetical protein
VVCRRKVTIADPSSNQAADLVLVLTHARHELLHEELKSKKIKTTEFDVVHARES